MKIVLLAGGQGTRLWPISTPKKPKQFQAIGTEHSLLRETFLRVKEIGIENIFVITLEEQKFLVESELPDLYSDHIISAPESQDSAMGVAFALRALQEKGIENSETLIFLPADHIINPAHVFCDFLKKAEEYNNQFPESLMTIGISPTSPSTEFGYIQLNACKSDCEKKDFPLFKVTQFLEKPNKQRAEELLSEGNTVWNSGFIVGKQEKLLSAFEKHAPEFLKAYDSLEDFKKAPRISFDYAIWEKEENILCIPSNNAFSWNDVGNWGAVDNMNDHQKVVEVFGAKNNQVFSQSKKDVVLLGLEDVIVIEGENGLLVAKKSEIHSLKDALKGL